MQRERGVADQFERIDVPGSFNAQIETGGSGLDVYRGSSWSIHFVDVEVERHAQFQFEIEPYLAKGQAKNVLR